MISKRTSRAVPSENCTARADHSWLTDQQRIYSEESKNSSAIRARLTRELLNVMSDADRRCVDPVAMASRAYPRVPCWIIVLIHTRYFVEAADETAAGG
jgi:hypothetical protein